jgi:pyroglutamyl-peptidase
LTSNPHAPLLITGFEPFGGEPDNPSMQVCQALDGRVVGGWPVVGEVLPCVFAQSVPALSRALRRYRPRAVLALGLAGSRQAVSFERVAINWMDARIPDNAGDQPVDVPVVAGGPSAHFTRLPIKALAEVVQARGMPAELSFTAGSFVCNQVFYALLHALRRRPQVPAGFIHLPPSGRLGLADQVAAIEAVIEALASGVSELRVPGGETD